VGRMVGETCAKRADARKLEGKGCEEDQDYDAWTSFVMRDVD